MTRKMIITFIVSVLLFVITIVLLLVQHMRTGEKIILYFKAMPECRYRYICNGDMVIGQLLRNNDYEKTELYLYLIKTEEEHYMFYRYADKKGDMKNASPEVPFGRVDIITGYEKPYHYEFYDYDNTEISLWFNTIEAIVFKQENRINSPPLFVNKTPWLRKIVLGKTAP